MAWADGTFYCPTNIEYDRPENYDLKYEPVTIASTDDCKLAGWFFPAENPVGTVLHCHGNAGNITAHFKFCAWLPARGWNVLCFDYRGYGQSIGKADRQGTIDDACAALEYIRRRPDVDAHRICVFGQSLGGAVVIVALARMQLDIAGLCIDGAFSSYRQEARFVARHTWYLAGGAPLIARWLISDDLSPIACVDRLGNYPKLFICGDRDRIVDYRQTVELFNRATEPKDLWIIPDSDHTEAATGQIEGGRERILQFLQRCVC